MKIILSTCLLVTASIAQNFEFYPGTKYDPSIPTLRNVVGHDFGTKITTPEEAERYAFELAAASDRITAFRYGESWEGRPLYYLVIGSEERQQSLAKVQTGMRKLADPRGLSDADKARLTAELPVITWLSYCVHGDEVSGTDSGLLLAYHLVAAQGDEVIDKILKESLVIVDPLQNPDGRARFVFNYRQTRGRWPDAQSSAAEHDQPWPGGRTNHYLFDMNRDWFAMTQKETRARVAAYQEWWPQVFVDLHEMGRNSSYYFAPPAKPHNPEITAEQHEWLFAFGRNNANWFDSFGFDYFTRESFDSFYPGYGEGWPLFHGAIGMTYEQAGVRGLVVEREDHLLMHYRDSVQRHFIASLATTETAADNRQKILQSFVNYRSKGCGLAIDGEITSYLFPQGRDPHRTQELMASLSFQGIEVQIAKSEIRSSAANYLDGKPESRRYPAGTYIIRLDQPSHHLAVVLLARQFAMDPEFMAEQHKRYSARKGTEFFDLTGWALPLLWDLECHRGFGAIKGETEVWTEDADSEDQKLHANDLTPRVAWVIPWGTHGAIRALCDLLSQKIRVRCADRPFTLDGREFPHGSLVIKSRNNGDQVKLRASLAKISREHSVDVVLAESSWVEKGIHFGSNRMVHLEQPRIAMAYDRPVSSNSVGWARHVLEQQFEYPVTLIRTRRLASTDLSKFNVLILPAGRYGSEFGKSGAESIKRWVRSGGTLITLGSATRWLIGKDVGLLASKTEDRKKPKTDKGDVKKDDAKKEEGDDDKGKSAKKTEEAKPFDYQNAILPEKESPSRTPGALLRVRLDPDHWLAFGYSDATYVPSVGREIYVPVKLNKGTNVGVFAKRESLLASGFAWRDKLDQLAEKAYLVHQPHGKGHVVAFAEDPNFRGFAKGLQQLFMNAVLLGPGH